MRNFSKWAHRGFNRVSTVFQSFFKRVSTVFQAFAARDQLATVAINPTVHQSTQPCNQRNPTIKPSVQSTPLCHIACNFSYETPHGSVTHRFEKCFMDHSALSHRSFIVQSSFLCSTCGVRFQVRTDRHRSQSQSSLIAIVFAIIVIATTNGSA